MMVQRGFSLVLVLSGLLLAGCGTVQRYVSPGVDVPHATVAFLKPATFDFWVDTGQVMVFSNADCTPENEGRLLTEIFYSTPDPARVFAEVPIFLRVATVRYGSTMNFACINVTRLTPRAGQSYEVVQQFVPNNCLVTVRDASGEDSADAERVSVSDSCRLPGWDAFANKAVKPKG